MPRIPRSPEDITIDWMNTVLSEGGHLGRHRVVEVTARDSDIPGQTAEIAKVSVEYDDEECPLPRNLVAKYRSRNQLVIDQIINVYELYWREASFYTEFPRVGIAVPSVFCAKHDPDTQDFVLLMQDLAPAESPSWASTPEQVATAVTHLPAFHAKWWNADLLRSKDWLVQYDNRAFFLAAAEAANSAFPKMREFFGNDVEETMAVLEIWLADLDRLLGFVATRPFTLVHGDYHAKQMFFPTAEGGDFAIIDWQFSFVAQGAWDLIRIVTLGQDAAARRERQDELIESYHRQLLAHGVEDYPLSALHDDIRFGLLINQMIMAVALIDTDISVLERECTSLGVDWRDVLLLRGEAAIRDWNVVDFVKSHRAAAGVA